MNKNNINKIKFIITFIIIYIILTLTTTPIGEKLIIIQRDLIFLVFGNYFNYHNFIFVPFCSGIVSISVLLSTVISFKVIKKKISFFWTILSIILLFFINIIRLIFILFIEKISNSYVLTEVGHILSWFFMAIIIIILIKKIVK